MSEVEEDEWHKFANANYYEGKHKTKKPYHSPLEQKSHEIFQREKIYDHFPDFDPQCFEHRLLEKYTQIPSEFYSLYIYESLRANRLLNLSPDFPVFRSVAYLGE